MANSEQQETLFRKQAKNYQSYKGRTKRAGFKEGLMIIGAAIVIPILLFEFPLWAGFVAATIRNIPSLFTILIVMWVILIASAIGFTIHRLFRSTKSISCPKCNTQVSVYSNVKKYMCPNCWALLLMGDNSDSKIELLKCLYCGLQTAITADYGSFLCPNCGVPQDSGQPIKIESTTKCPKCLKPVPYEAIYCIDCKEVLKSVYSVRSIEGHDLDWKIGKDATGHFYYAKAIIESIREQITNREKDSKISDVEYLLKGIESALISIEECLKEPELRSSVETFIYELDRTYGDLLAWELQLLEDRDPAKRYPTTTSMKSLVEEPQIAPRRRVEDLLKRVSKWNDKLVEIVYFSEGKQYQIKSYDRLREEVIRLSR